MDNQQENQFVNGQAMSIRTFIGAKDFDQSREFYQELGFAESTIANDMSYFSVGDLGFYLQKYYVKDWVNNSMVFFEVVDAQETYDFLASLELSKKFPGVRLLPLKEEAWGKECFLHDPSGVLWHFGQFYY